MSKSNTSRLEISGINMVSTYGRRADKFDLRVNSSYPETSMVIRARKPGARVIVWNIVTSADGARRILTSRNLSGYTLSLLVDDEVFHRVRVR